MSENKSSAGCFDNKIEVPAPVSERVQEILSLEALLDSYHKQAGEPEEDE